MRKIKSVFYELIKLDPKNLVEPTIYIYKKNTIILNSV